MLNFKFNMMNDPKDKTKQDNQTTEDNQTNLNLGEKDELSTSSPDHTDTKNSESSNKEQGPSGEDL